MCQLISGRHNFILDTQYFIRTNLLLPTTYYQQSSYLLPTQKLPPTNFKIPKLIRAEPRADQLNHLVSSCVTHSSYLSVFSLDYRKFDPMPLDIFQKPDFCRFQPLAIYYDARFK